MPTDIKSLMDDLEKESSLLRLPKKPQSSAQKILETIQRHKLKRKTINATTLREEVRIDPHRYHPIFKWLLTQNYCTTTKDSIDKRSKLVNITKAGENALRKLDRIGRLKDISRDLYRASSPTDENKKVVELIVEAFDLAHSELHYGGKTESYQQFREDLEEGIRQKLNKDIDDRFGHIYDVSLGIRKIRRDRLLKDANLARERGDFLTRNHRYVLHHLEGVGEKKLEEHNVQWRNKIMNMQFSGNESDADLPWVIVRRERKERGIIKPPKPREIMYTTDEYDLKHKWEPDFDELRNRYEQARRRQKSSILDYAEVK